MPTGPNRRVVPGMGKSKDTYSEAEAKRRFEQALKGAAKVAKKAPKKTKKKPA